MKKTLVVLGTIFLVTIAIAFVGCQGAAEVESPTQSLSLIMGEGKIISEVGGEDTITGEFHRWEPSVLVVNKGDEVVLSVTNPRSKVHSLAIPAFGVVSSAMEPRGGTATVEFTADKAGVFQFACDIPFSRDDGALDCNLDHVRQVGYLIVLEH